MKTKSFFAISILIAFAQSITASDKVIITGNVRVIPDSTDDGTRLILTDSNGITPRQEIKVDENGTKRFSLIYNPLP